MNILEYIEELVADGYSEEDAGRLADVMFNDNWEMEDVYED